MYVSVCLELVYRYMYLNCHRQQCNSLSFHFYFVISLSSFEIQLNFSLIFYRIDLCGDFRCNSWQLLPSITQNTLFSHTARYYTEHKNIIHNLWNHVKECLMILLHLYCLWKCIQHLRKFNYMYIISAAVIVMFFSL